jgi:hypothetical protein
VIRKLRTPSLWGDIGNVLRERPAMTLEVFGGVLALAERFVARRLENLCATSLRMLEVAVDVLDGDVDVLVDLATPRRAEHTTLPPEHDCAIRNQKLGMQNNTVAFDPQALGESKSSAEPCDRLAGILIHQNRHDGCGRCGLIHRHLGLLNYVGF